MSELKSVYIDRTGDWVRSGNDTGKFYLKEEVDATIAELKQKLQDQCISCPVKMQEDDVVAELKQKLENVQASMYADVVDANMENRRLKRALWLARTLRARDIQRWWIAATCAPKTERACSVWNNVERKCRAKAEEYK